MNDIDFGFTEQEKEWVSRRVRQQDRTLAYLVLAGIVAVTVLHFFLLPAILPNFG